MDNSGRNPERESRRAGDFVLGSDGKPLRDRYGRPVRRHPRNNDPGRSTRNQGSQRAQGTSRPSDNTRLPHPDEVQRRPRADYTRQLPPEEQFQRPQQQQPRYPSQFRAMQQRQQQPQYQQRYAQQPQRAAVPRNYQPAPGRAQRPHRRRKRVSPVKRFFGCFGWFTAILLVLALAIGFWADTRLTRVDAMPEEQVSNTAGTNWLLVGSDSRQGLTEEDQANLGTGGDVGVGRTDTIMVLHMPTFGKARLVSIPRDSYVEVPGFGMDKINASFTYGGPQLLTQTVESATGLHIDHYAEIGMGGLANVVDAVGGVEVCLDEPINDPLAAIDLAAGCQELDGPNALGYVRTRATAMGDLDRVERQREFFSALLGEITSPMTFINPVRAISLVNNTASAFIVDNGDHIWHLLRVALAMGTGVETETVPIGSFQDTAVGNVVVWDEAEAAQLWESMK